VPSTYTPDPTSTQAPASQPDPDDFPLESLPNSGEGCTAASIAQAFKVLGDFAAWERKPRAKVSQWEQAIKPYRDARLNRRFIVDHFGLPRGEWMRWRERFKRRGDWTHGAGTWSTQDWDFLLTETTPATSNVRANQPFGAGGFAAQPYLEIEIDNSGANTGEMKLPPDSNTIVWSPDMLAELDYTLNPADAGAPTTWVHGVCGQTEHINTITTGAFFISAAGGNWHARTINGGAPTDTDTGIAGTAGAGHHFLMAMVGANLGDDSTSRCLFFVDGVLKANHTTQLPVAGTQVHPIFGGFTSGVGGGTKKLHLGMPGWGQNTSAATP
jgi:hypothetical protein